MTEQSYISRADILVQLLSPCQRFRLFLKPSLKLHNITSEDDVMNPGHDQRHQLLSAVLCYRGAFNFHPTINVLQGNHI
jgi:hypothetical protein